MDQRVVIAQLNIEHYRRKLATKADPAKRLMLLRLLAKEEARLAELKQSTGAQPAWLPPLSPVCRPKVAQLLLCLRVDPTAEDTAARKHRSVWPSTGIEDSEF
jgi:hypothetical protein